MASCFLNQCRLRTSEKTKQHGRGEPVPKAGGDALRRIRRPDRTRSREGSRREEGEQDESESGRAAETNHGKTLQRWALRPASMTVAAHHTLMSAFLTAKGTLSSRLFVGERDFFVRRKTWPLLLPPARPFRKTEETFRRSQEAPRSWGKTPRRARKGRRSFPRVSRIGPGGLRTGPEGFRNPPERPRKVP